MNNDEYRKYIKEPPEFTDLVADVTLKSEAALLGFEDESDKRCLEFILRQKNGISGKQRNWLKLMISRKGKKFSKTA